MSCGGQAPWVVAQCLLIHFTTTKQLLLSLLSSSVLFCCNTHTHTQPKQQPRCQHLPAHTHTLTTWPPRNNFLNRRSKKLHQVPSPLFFCCVSSILLCLLQHFSEIWSLPPPPKGYNPNIKPPGQREWTPTQNGATGAHSAAGYQKQVGLVTGMHTGINHWNTWLLSFWHKKSTGPPPKKSLADLPWDKESVYSSSSWYDLCTANLVNILNTRNQAFKASLQFKLKDLNHVFVVLSWKSLVWLSIR